MSSVAIVGAGLAGLTAARALQDYAEVKIFEKSRGVGGRLATRRADSFQFDHGAQFFKVRSAAFQDFLEPLLAAGVVQRWDARFVEIAERAVRQSWQWGADYPHYVGAPGMNAVGKYLCVGLNVELESRVQAMSKRGAKWSLTDADGQELGSYDWVLLTAPAQQTASLLPPEFVWAEQASSVPMQGCFSLMLGFEQPLALEFDAALVRGEDISWVSVNSSKPGRATPFCLLIHSTNNWADANFEQDREFVLDYLCQQSSAVLGHDLSKAQHKAVHGWRFANLKKSAGPSHWLDSEQRVGVCGDWFIQGRVEAAFTSGAELAQELIGRL